ncbi:unnamed protein product [Clonostachys chloroleuca]|uniref:Uncharacterized protein n=1 Tax=Clonostachys chloroleuca TaxID=1926264 RepID=A0AA35MHW5_9HYPO|nr:unnamed protein product [Clonostachys chloroleuca]
MALVGEDGGRVGEEDGGEEVRVRLVDAVLELDHGLKVLGPVGVPYVEALRELHPGLDGADVGGLAGVAVEAQVEHLGAEEGGFAVVAEHVAGEVSGGGRRDSGGEDVGDEDGRLHHKPSA